MRKLCFLIVIGSALGVSTLAGCGGSSSPTVSSIRIDGQKIVLHSGGVGKGNYTNSVNQVCTQTQMRIDTESVRQFRLYRLRKRDQPTNAQLAQVIQVALIPTVQAELSRLVKLPVPANDVDTLNQVYSAYQSSLDKVERKPALLLKEDVFAPANKLAQDYGLYSCVIK